MTNAHLVKLSGMGDHHWYLLDDAAWSYLEACCDRQRGTPTPAIPDAVVEEHGEDDRDEALDALTLNPRSSSGDNDIALNLAPSKFNGESFLSFEASIADLNAFVAKHQLTLHEAYDGYIY